MMTRREELEKVRAEIRACRACAERGYPIRPRPVLGGALDARILLVGQAPGVTEAEEAVPFCGPAGKRLFTWLEPAGFPRARIRDEVYFCAMTRCYPGKDGRGTGDRRPSREELALCAPFLAREFALVDPLLVLLVGQMAIERFLGKMPLRQAVGQEFEAEGRTYLPLPHPSGASTWLNAPENQERLRQALILVGRHYRRVKELAPPCPDLAPA